MVARRSWTPRSRSCCALLKPVRRSRWMRCHFLCPRWQTDTVGSRKLRQKWASAGTEQIPDGWATSEPTPRKPTCTRPTAPPRLLSEDPAHEYSAGACVRSDRGCMWPNGSGTHQGACVVRRAWLWLWLWSGLGYHAGYRAAATRTWHGGKCGSVMPPASRSGQPHSYRRRPRGSGGTADDLV